MITPVQNTTQTKKGTREMIPIQVNPHMMSIFLKELVRRAIVAIRNERFKFEAKVKTGYSGEDNDLVTSADIAAQAIYQKSIEESLPGVGIIGEEQLNLPCTLKGVDVYITVDPLDGTKAFGRKQSHGTATMVALVINGEVVSAYIGDVNTQEVYGYRPDTRAVQRISQYEIAERLDKIPRDNRPLNEQLILLREFPRKITQLEERALLGFKDVHVDSGSIGIWMTRLWKGEVGAVLMEHFGHETPWDSTPVIGISQKLGFIFLRPSKDKNGTWEKYDPILPKQIIKREYPTLIIHKDSLPSRSISFS